MKKQNDKYQELYGAIQWVNDNPILDGMIAFEKKEDCLEYIKKQELIYEKIKKKYSAIHDSQWTMPRIKLEK